MVGVVPSPVPSGVETDITFEVTWMLDTTPDSLCQTVAAEYDIEFWVSAPTNACSGFVQEQVDPLQHIQVESRANSWT